MSDLPLTIRVELPAGLATSPPILALGGELKSSICLSRDGVARISEPAGDLEQEEVYRHFCDLISSLSAQSGPALKAIAIDKHPDYLSAQYGERLAKTMGLPLLKVQHHHAHIAAAMADNRLPRHAKPVLGLALDGLGFGEDGTLWGGEFLLADYRGFERLGRLMPVAMIGGSAAIHEPWRNLFAHLLPFMDEVTGRFGDMEIMRFLSAKPVDLMRTMVERGANAPPASSCGRLFDAVAAATGLQRECIAYEAEAAMALEKAASRCFGDEAGHYAYDAIYRNGLLQLEWRTMWLELLADLQNGVTADVVAARFHRTLIRALAESSIRLCREKGGDTVALSGGVFQNRLISAHLPVMLKQAGLTVLQHRQVQAHDGGISLGQAVVAAEHFSSA